MGNKTYRRGDIEETGVYYNDVARIDCDMCGESIGHMGQYFHRIRRSDGKSIRFHLECFN